MKASDLLSAAWLLSALLGVTWLGMRGADAKSPLGSREPADSVAANATYARLAGGALGVVDASGELVPVRHYVRIAGLSTLADTLLLALTEPERIDALSRYGRDHSEAPHLYGERFPIAGPEQLETLIERRVDLVIMNDLRSPARLARTRESGIEVFNLGEMRGLSTLLPNIAAVAALVGAPERGRAYAAKLVRRMKMVAADIPAARRKRALYVSVYANQLLGGAAGTSYHDVLVHAGLRDATDGRYTGFPQYDPEQLVELDPELIVANEGTAESLCLLGGLARLRACQNGGAGVISLPTDLLGDPGPRMLDAAEALRTRVYGPPR